jgi:GT2 family glycosyltransferase
MKLGKVIINRQNLSCGTAWNQGILTNQSEWTILINNDIVVTENFVNKLINFAKENNLKLVSPARIDGQLDYDFNNFTQSAQNTTFKCIRWGSSNAICLCIHWSVFEEIGFFRANRNLLGFEDGLFYNEINKHNILHGTTGSVWIHHFGSVTQDHLKMVLGIKNDSVIVKFNDRKLYGQSWIERKLLRLKLKNSHKAWHKDELNKYNMTLHGTRNNNEFLWL